MANLTKQLVTNERVSLVKEDGTAISKLHVGAGWDVPLFPGANPVDIDAYAFILGSDGKCLGVDYFIAGAGGFTKADGSAFDHDPEGAIRHSGDNLTGEGDGEDEGMDIDLTKVRADAAKIVFITAIYDATARNQKFGMVENAFFRAVDPDSGEEWKFDLTEDYDQKTAIVGLEVYRHNGQWKLKAAGEGLETGDIVQLWEKYGLDPNA